MVRQLTADGKIAEVVLLENDQVEVIDLNISPDFVAPFGTYSSDPSAPAPASLLSTTSSSSNSSSLVSSPYSPPNFSLNQEPYPGDLFDIKDNNGNWFQACILYTKKREEGDYIVRVGYIGFSDSFDEWMLYPSDRFRNISNSSSRGILYRSDMNEIYMNRKSCLDLQGNEISHHEAVKNFVELSPLAPVPFIYGEILTIFIEFNGLLKIIELLGEISSDTFSFGYSDQNILKLLQIFPCISPHLSYNTILLISPVISLTCNLVCSKFLIDNSMIKKSPLDFFISYTLDTFRFILLRWRGGLGIEETYNQDLSSPSPYRYFESFLFYLSIRLLLCPLLSRQTQGIKILNDLLKSSNNMHLISQYSLPYLPTIRYIDYFPNATEMNPPIFYKYDHSLTISSIPINFSLDKISILRLISSPENCISLLHNEIQPYYTRFLKDLSTNLNSSDENSEVNISPRVLLINIFNPHNPFHPTIQNKLNLLLYSIIEQDLLPDSIITNLFMQHSDLLMTTYNGKELLSFSSKSLRLKLFTLFNEINLKNIAPYHINALNHLSKNNSINQENIGDDPYLFPKKSIEVIFNWLNMEEENVSNDIRQSCLNLMNDIIKNTCNDENFFNIWEFFLEKIVVELESNRNIFSNLEFLEYFMLNFQEKSTISSSDKLLELFPSLYEIIFKIIRATFQLEEDNSKKLSNSNFQRILNFYKNLVKFSSDFYNNFENDLLLLCEIFFKNDNFVSHSSILIEFLNQVPDMILFKSINDCNIKISNIPVPFETPLSDKYTNILISLFKRLIYFLSSNKQFFFLDSELAFSMYHKWFMLTNFYINNLDVNVNLVQVTSVYKSHSLQSVNVHIEDLIGLDIFLLFITKSIVYHKQSPSYYSIHFIIEVLGKIEPYPQDYHIYLLKIVVDELEILYTNNSINKSLSTSTSLNSLLIFLDELLVHEILTLSDHPLTSHNSRVPFYKIKINVMFNNQTIACDKVYRDIPVSAIIERLKYSFLNSLDDFNLSEEDRNLINSNNLIFYLNSHEITKHDMNKKIGELKDAKKYSTIQIAIDKNKSECEEDLNRNTQFYHKLEDQKLFDFFTKSSLHPLLFGLISSQSDPNLSYFLWNKISNLPTCTMRASSLLILENSLNQIVFSSDSITPINIETFCNIFYFLELINIFLSSDEVELLSLFKDNQFASSYFSSENSFETLITSWPKRFVEHNGIDFLFSLINIFASETIFKSIPSQFLLECLQLLFHILKGFCLLNLYEHILNNPSIKFKRFFSSIELMPNLFGQLSFYKDNLDTTYLFVNGLTHLIGSFDIIDSSMIYSSKSTFDVCSYPSFSFNRIENLDSGFELDQFGDFDSEDISHIIKIDYSNNFFNSFSSLIKIDTLTLKNKFMNIFDLLTKFITNVSICLIQPALDSNLFHSLSCFSNLNLFMTSILNGFFILTTYIFFNPLIISSNELLLVTPSSSPIKKSQNNFHMIEDSCYNFQKLLLSLETSSSTISRCFSSISYSSILNNISSYSEGIIVSLEDFYSKISTRFVYRIFFILNDFSQNNNLSSFTLDSLFSNYIVDSIISIKPDISLENLISLNQSADYKFPFYKSFINHFFPHKYNSIFFQQLDSTIWRNSISLIIVDMKLLSQAEMSIKEKFISISPSLIEHLVINFNLIGLLLSLPSLSFPPILPQDHYEFLLTSVLHIIPSNSNFLYENQLKLEQFSHLLLHKCEDYSNFNFMSLINKNSSITYNIFDYITLSPTISTLFSSHLMKCLSVIPSSISTFNIQAKILNSFIQLKDSLEMIPESQIPYNVYQQRKEYFTFTQLENSPSLQYKDFNFPCFSNKDINQVLENKSYFTGLVNLGSTCYMNSLLQVFFHEPLIKDYMLLSNFDSLCNSEKDFNAPIFQFQSLILEMEHTNMKTISTSALVNTLRDPSGLEKVDVMMQHDAVEFMNIFFDTIEDDVKKLRNEFFKGKNFEILTPINIFQETYQGYLVNILSPKHSKVNKYKLQPEKFFTLSLSIQDCSTLEDSLDKFFNGEEIHDYKWTDDKLLNEENGAVTPSLSPFSSTVENSVNTSILTVPRIGTAPQSLLIHLQRFEWDLDTSLKLKIHSSLAFPLSISLYKYSLQMYLASNPYIKISPEIRSFYSEIDEEDFFYELSGVVVHLGNSDSGHYISFLRTSNVNDKTGEYQWYEFNDSEVLPYDINYLSADCYGSSDRDFNISDPTFMSTKSAYILVYTKKKKQSINSVLDKLKKNFEEIKEEEKINSNIILKNTYKLHFFDSNYLSNTLLNKIVVKNKELSLNLSILNPNLLDFFSTILNNFINKNMKLKHKTLFSYIFIKISQFLINTVSFTTLIGPFRNLRLILSNFVTNFVSNDSLFSEVPRSFNFIKPQSSCINQFSSENDEIEVAIPIIDNENRINMKQFEYDEIDLDSDIIFDLDEDFVENWIASIPRDIENLFSSKSFNACNYILSSTELCTHAYNYPLSLHIPHSNNSIQIPSILKLLTVFPSSMAKELGCFLSSLIINSHPRDTKFIGFNLESILNHSILSICNEKVLQSSNNKGKEDDQIALAINLSLQEQSNSSYKTYLSDPSPVYNFLTYLTSISTWILIKAQWRSYKYLAKILNNIVQIAPLPSSLRSIPTAIIDIILGSKSPLLTYKYFNNVGFAGIIPGTHTPSSNVPLINSIITQYFEKNSSTLVCYNRLKYQETLKFESKIPDWTELLRILLNIIYFVRFCRIKEKIIVPLVSPEIKKRTSQAAIMKNNFNQPFKSSNNIFISANHSPVSLFPSLIYPNFTSSIPTYNLMFSSLDTHSLFCIDFYTTMVKQNRYIPFLKEIIMLMSYDDRSFSTMIVKMISQLLSDMLNYISLSQDVMPFKQQQFHDNIDYIDDYDIALPNSPPSNSTTPITTSLEIESMENIFHLLEKFLFINDVFSTFRAALLFSEQNPPELPFSLIYIIKNYYETRYNQLQSSSLFNRRFMRFIVVFNKSLINLTIKRESTDLTKFIYSKLHPYFYWSNAFLERALNNSQNPSVYPPPLLQIYGESFLTWNNSWYQHAFNLYYESQNIFGDLNNSLNFSNSLNLTTSFISQNQTYPSNGNPPPSSTTKSKSHLSTITKYLSGEKKEKEKKKNVNSNELILKDGMTDEELEKYLASHKF